MHQLHIKSYFYLDIKDRMNERPSKEAWYCDAWPRVELHREQHPRRSLHWAITCDQETFVYVCILNSVYQLVSLGGAFAHL